MLGSLCCLYDEPQVTLAIPLTVPLLKSLTCLGVPRIWTPAIISVASAHGRNVSGSCPTCVHDVWSPWLFRIVVYVAASIEKDDVASKIFPACVEIVALDLVLSLVWIGAPRTDRTQNDTLMSRWRWTAAMQILQDLQRFESSVFSKCGPKHMSFAVWLEQSSQQRANFSDEMVGHRSMTIRSDPCEMSQHTDFDTAGIQVAWLELY